MSRSSMPCVTIDFPQNRIRVYKHTLHLLQDPLYIRFLVNPQDRFLGVQIANKDDPSAYKVGNRIKAKRCVEIHSMTLLEDLHQCTKWEKDASYTLHAMAAVDNTLIVFKLDEALRNE